MMVLRVVDGVVLSVVGIWVTVVDGVVVVVVVVQATAAVEVIFGVVAALATALAVVRTIRPMDSTMVGAAVVGTDMVPSIFCMYAGASRS